MIIPEPRWTSFQSTPLVPRRQPLALLPPWWSLARPLLSPLLPSLLVPPVLTTRLAISWLICHTNWPSTLTINQSQTCRRSGSTTTVFTPAPGRRPVSRLATLASSPPCAIPTLTTIVSVSLDYSHVLHIPEFCFCQAYSAIISTVSLPLTTSPTRVVYARTALGPRRLPISS